MGVRVRVHVWTCSVLRVDCGWDPPVSLAVKGSLGLKGHFPLPDSTVWDNVNNGSCRTDGDHTQREWPTNTGAKRKLCPCLQTDWWTPSRDGQRKTEARQRETDTKIWHSSLMPGIKWKQETSLLLLWHFCLQSYNYSKNNKNRL